MPSKEENYKAMLGRWFDHAQQRAMERYGILYTEELQRQVVMDIGNLVYNKLLDIPKSSRAVYRGRLCEEVVTFIFCQKHKTIITFLHNTWVDTDTEEFYVLSSNRRKYSNLKRKDRLSKGGHLRMHGSGRLRKVRAPRKIQDYKAQEDWEA
jgi:hypothetical protein